MAAGQRKLGGAMEAVHHAMGHSWVILASMAVYGKMISGVAWSMPGGKYHARSFPVALMRYFLYDASMDVNVIVVRLHASSHSKLSPCARGGFWLDLTIYSASLWFLPMDIWNHSFEHGFPLTWIRAATVSMITFRIKQMLLARDPWSKTRHLKASFHLLQTSGCRHGNHQLLYWYPNLRNH